MGDLTHRQQVVLADARNALAAEQSGDVPDGVNAGNAAEYWQVYFRIRLAEVVKAFPGDGQGL